MRARVLALGSSVSNASHHLVVVDLCGPSDGSIGCRMPTLNLVI
ncbi:hypothetical protein [Sandaracinus amylolyticus]|nr:hypothetical protein [Sandaracinus amylolyticus]UJR87274.1 Hypothetical protein I5071_660 [Sandaracinus amylolyticus]